MYGDDYILDYTWGCLVIRDEDGNYWVVNDDIDLFDGEERTTGDQDGSE